MKSSTSSLSSRFSSKRRGGQGERETDEKAPPPSLSSTSSAALSASASSPLHQTPSSTPPTSTSATATLVVEPLHALSSAAIHTTSLDAAAQALRAGGAGGERGKEGGVGNRSELFASAAVVPERENSPSEELLAVATMVALFGFVFLGPWLTLAALVDVMLVTMRTTTTTTTKRSSSSGATSSSPTFAYSLAFLAVVSCLSFLPVFPSKAWPYFRDARVWDCWRRYFRLRIVSPPLPYLEMQEKDEGEDKGEKEPRGANGKAPSPSAFSPPLPPNDPCRRNKKSYIFAHYPHGCFPVGSFLTAVGLVGCDGTGLPAGTRPSVASALFHLPVLRQVYTWCNCVPCDSKTLSNLLRSGTSIGVIPEGIAGIFHGSSAAKVSSLVKDLLPSPPPSSPTATTTTATAAAHATRAAVVEERIFTKHKGYIKLALRTGAGIVPVYALGQSRVLSFLGLHSLSRRLRLSLGIWFGRFGLPCLPRKEEIVIVVCPPIDVGEPRSEPTQEEIDAVFDKVAASLKRAHDGIKVGVRNWESSEMVFCE